MSTNVDAKFDYAFAKIDTWTDTWRSLTKGINDPVTGEKITFATLKNILADSGFGGDIDGSDTRQDIELIIVDIVQFNQEGFLDINQVE